jgi:Co/Zn/Cd efflux system component
MRFFEVIFVDHSVVVLESDLLFFSEHNTTVKTNIKKRKKTRDLNIWAVFIHYLSDALSSLCVLATGVLTLLFREKVWIVYLDPLSG